MRADARTRACHTDVDRGHVKDAASSFHAPSAVDGQVSPWVGMKGKRLLAIQVVLLAALAVLALSGDLQADEPAVGPDAGAPSAGRSPPSSPAKSRRPEKPAPSVRVTGTAVLPDGVARTAIGPPPSPGGDVRGWGEQAVQRIVAAYRARGYRYARAWFSDSKEPGVLWFDVDEGRMRVSFVGMGSISATLFRLRLIMPGGVFQEDDIDRSLAEQKVAFNLVTVSYTVHETEGGDMTIFDQVVPARTLEIHVASSESFGWALDISASAAWGVVPRLRYSAADLLWHDDRLLVVLDVAVPYRRYIFDAAPKITWVHGVFDLSYRLPHFALGRKRFRGFAPRLNSSISVSQYARADLRLASLYLSRDVTTASLVSSWPDVELSLGFGADVARVFLLRTASSQPGQPPVEVPGDVYSARALVRATGQWTSARPWTRRDRRTIANVVVDICAPAELRASVWGQYVSTVGRHRLFLRGRGLEVAGNIPFWDDVELAGNYQRVFFNDLYWVHQAAQIEIAYQIRLWRDWFEAGVFHDLSVYGDRISSPTTLRAMDAFGPSLHFLILDQYALSIHQGLGFAPGRFSQTISFTVESVF